MKASFDREDIKMSARAVTYYDIGKVDPVTELMYSATQ